MERVRIKDIAKMADVSVGTVDRVIHGRSGVSESSRKRVEEILKQLDYQLSFFIFNPNLTFPEILSLSC